MSRRPQREQTVQRRALKWLARRYAASTRAKRIVGLEEAHIARHERWRGRVDGLLAFEHPVGTVHTVAIEAKSSKLLGEVKGQEGCGTLALVMTVAFVLGAGIAWWFVTSRYNGWLGALAALVGGIVAGFLGLVVVARSPRFVTHAVIDQVERYPGTHRWIVLAKDMMSDDLRETFAVECRAHGIGLLVVPRRGEPVVELDPAPADHADLLPHYSRANEISEILRTSKPGIHLKFRNSRRWELLVEEE